MLSWVSLRGINAHSVSPQAPARYSWYQFYCLVNRNTRALVACPELLVRKSVDSGIEPATLRSPGYTSQLYWPAFIYIVREQIYSDIVIIKYGALIILC